jgi:hypothetical protein
MRGLLLLTLKHKAIAVAAAAVLSAGGAATFASQDAVFQGPDNGTSTQVVGQEATFTPEAVDEATPTATAVVEEATPTPEPEVDEATPTPEPTEVVEPTPTATVDDGDDEDEGEGPRDVVGIPDDNPSKQPEDGDGVCEKGETVIKTTPSGKQVNVPCQAVKEHGNKAGHLEDDEEGTE